MKFGKDGTLYANTIRYNYKQARNLVPDGSGCQKTTIWSMENVSIVTGKYGYKTNRAFLLNNSSGTAMLSVPMPTPIAGHKYYGGILYKTSGTEGSSIGGDTRFEWYIGDSATGTMVFGYKNVHTGGKWKKLSSVQTLSSVTAGSWRIRNFLASSGCSEMYVCKHIIIDLTDTFGAGNEPNKDWCDNNIREWEVYINWGTVWSSIPNGSLGLWSGSALSGFHQYEWLALDSNWEPREFMYHATASTSNSEGYLNSIFNSSLSPDTTYYVSYDAIMASDYSTGNRTINAYWPVAEPSFGQYTPRRISDANGGGGMGGWRRYSWFGNRSSFASGSYPARLDLDNRGSSMEARITAISCNAVADSVSYYNECNGTNIFVSDVNKEWCDRWIDHRSSPIIHIGDPSKRDIIIKKTAKVVKRNAIYNYAVDSLNGWMNMEDNWSDFPTSGNDGLVYGDRVCVAITIDGTSGYVIGIFRSLSNGVLAMYNESFCKSGSAEYTACESGYDIVCNDIEIRPEVNSVTFKPNGTIVCKKLIKTQVY